MNLANNWWMFLVRGIVAILLGLIALFWPEVAILSLVLIVGVFALFSGIFAMISAFTSNAKSENWSWLILEGIFGIGLGILSIFQPQAMAKAWLILIAAWLIVSGIFQIITAIAIRKVIEGEFWMILGGSISLLFGFLILFAPSMGVAAIGIIIGLFAILFGIVCILFAISLKRHNLTVSVEELTIE
jgi:uncharacterized membrane protein HdeD (DUF308 family)